MCVCVCVTRPQWVEREPVEGIMHGRHVWINTLIMISAFITMWHFTTNLCLVVHKLWYLYLRFDYIMRYDFGHIFLSDRRHCDRLSIRPWLQQCLRKLTGIYRLNAIYRCVTTAPYHPYVRLLCYDSVDVSYIIFYHLCYIHSGQTGFCFRYYCAVYDECK